ncbi:DeoR family transcriptional regulator [Leifsonia sp. Root4]|uniref:DeoR/GlpR family DNA-binding transcription regulator n=1 Tax=Leifsonia sp. Root4 TaxID=1736525 RepID=UPI0006F97503|nr:DeoR/GlpR family DNA-binding transcription regulator [Leifsonia sp. Root4]KQW06596.1 DeoR family transcriptional regulator [Leifsonia sp. Root4]
MLAAQRHEYLLEKLRTERKVVAKEVAAELRLSEDSIRRDLRELAAAGKCQRVYGGALPISAAIADYETRTELNVVGKQSVARAAAALIEPGQTVILDGGTTTLELVRELDRELALTVVTHSPTIAVALLGHPNIEVFMLGGRLFKHSAVTCGAAAVEAAAQVNADLFFVGVTGVHPETGFTTDDADEAAMKRTLARHSADTYVLADADKIGTASRFVVLRAPEIAGLITDAPRSSPTLGLLAEGGLSITYASTRQD